MELYRSSSSVYLRRVVGLTGGGCENVENVETEGKETFHSNKLPVSIRQRRHALSVPGESF